VVEKIKGLIYTHIRPAVARDGGDIVFKSFRGGVLSLDMRGACSGCPSSSATLKNGIQNLMSYFVPEVTEVVAA
jgi:Fe-S cluster biogenesis protein NfuA